ncbi:uncharacterized protein RCO7_03690 [Rhynchosporium graminicola]|uniref:Uncharacterized protein n=1 Tax=Rhynchosporium graminicola TaxID=2792576 RepID=A0A1E1LII9_9HELO|nr:uncharacterized protein RCO7_03690 [Rhynchosporium commune]
MEVAKKTSIFGSWRGRSRPNQVPPLPLRDHSFPSSLKNSDTQYLSSTASIPERKNTLGLVLLNQSTPPTLASRTIRQYPIDIVAIHGIRGGNYSTWTDKSNKESPYFWLQDSLPKEFPGARIYSFGYLADVFFTKNTGDFETFADDLLDQINNTRISHEEKRRPLIFVCHSMGGIIVKKALNTCKVDLRYRHILNAVPSILFLSTPHGGANPAEFAAMASRLLSLPIISRVKGPSHTDLIRSLTRNSKELHAISREFRLLTPYIQIFSFIEERITPPLKELLVDVVSGSLNVPTETIIRMPGCDHRTICCFESDKSQGFRKVSSKLREVVVKATSSHTSLLWIKGNPGTGKSTLMAFLHNHLTAAHPRNIHLSFFFNANGTLLQRSELGMLRSLTHQLYRLSPAARHIIFRTFKEKTQEFGEYYQHWEWNTEDLRALLLDILCMKPIRGEEIVIFIDALDEADGQDDPLLAGRLVEYFHGLSDRMLGTGSTTKMIISCRHYPVIATNIGMVINIEEGNTEDIAVYAEDQLRNGVQGWAQEQEIARKALEQAIVTKAEGVFLWVRLRLPKIIKSLNDGAWTLRMAPQLLQAESNELFTQYEDILIQKIDISLRKKSLHFLQWICLAERPLSVSEIRFAMACDDESMELDVKRCQNTASFVDSDERMRLLIKSLSGGLVEFRQHEHGTTVQPFHQTITSFLRLRGLQVLGNLLHPMSASESNNDTIGAAEQRLSTSCLNYLSSDEVRQAANGAINAIERRLIFINYASNHWLKHAARADRKNVQQNGTVNRLISQSGLFETWKLVHDETNPRELFRGCDLIHVMANSNILSGVTELLDKGVFIDKEDIRSNTALYHAAQNGHTEITELLLERGAKIDQKSFFDGWTPLKIAAKKGHLSVVRLLLKYGADINENTGPAGNALQMAAEGGDLRLVTTLVECGADVNTCGGRFHTALQAAAFGGHEEVAQYLIDHNADLNIQGGEAGSTLQAAVAGSAPEARRQSMVRLLLEYNADIELQGGQYGNSLQAAIAQENREMTELLLSCGANVKANVMMEGVKYGNALQAACHIRDKELVERFLDLGADIHAAGGEYGSVIQAAAHVTDNEDIISLLLERGANVNQPGGRFGSALQAASVCPGALAVDMLVKNGADINAQGGIYGNVLQAAVHGSNEDAARRFLAGGLDINGKGGKYGNILQASIESCKAEFISYLLDQGADINAQGGEYGNALRAAVFWKREHIIQLLLDRGARPDHQHMDTSFGSPLRLAAGRGYLSIVKILLDHGAEVNWRREQSTPALAAAITGGRKDVVELLLEHGADPDLPDRCFQSLGMKFPIADGSQDMARLLEERRRKVIRLEVGYEALSLDRNNQRYVRRG